MNLFFNVRKLVISDLLQVYRLLIQASDEDSISFRKIHKLSFFENLLSNDTEDDVIYGAFIEDELISLGGIYKNNKQNFRYEGWGFYVKPEHRNKGIGSLLIKRIISHAQTQSECRILVINVAEHNTKALKLHLRLGFNQYDLQNQYHTLILRINPILTL